VTHATTDTGATSIFIMKGTPIKNLRMADYLITITLPSGSKVVSTHICDITISCLPTILMGHIVPGITMASLIGIRILCKAGCKVTFDNKKCEVAYKNTIILCRYKDPTTDLWTLPLTFDKITMTNPVEVTISPNSAPCNPVVETASFSYARTNKINNVKFSHQSLCNPPSHPSSTQSMLDSSRVPTSGCTLSKKVSLCQSSHLKRAYEATTQGILKYSHYKARDRNPGAPNFPKTKTSGRPFYAQPKSSTAQ
jgi:hypothetical protein